MSKVPTTVLRTHCPDCRAPRGRTPPLPKQRHHPSNAPRKKNAPPTGKEEPEEHTFSFLCNDDDFLECFLNFPSVTLGQPFALDYHVLQTAQEADQRLQALVQTDPNKYMRIAMSDARQQPVQLICYVEHPNAPWKICIPDAMLSALVRWYHTVLNHVGVSRIAKMIGLHFYHANLKSACETVIAPCDACQRYKLQGRGYGELPSREAGVAPWRDVAVDLIGPWSIQTTHRNITCNALMIIDTVTNYCELIRIDNKSAAHVAQQFENAWLSRYPRPINVVFDQG